MMGTTMIVTNNSPIAYTFRAELSAGRQGDRRARPAPSRPMPGRSSSNGRRRPRPSASATSRPPAPTGAADVAKLYFYYAAMNAGKSTTLLQADFNYRERGMETMLWTAALRRSLGRRHDRLADRSVGAGTHL